MSEDVLGEIRVAEDRVEGALHVRRIDHDVGLGALGRVERELLEHGLHHRVEPARADVLGASIRLRRVPRDGVDRRIVERERDPLGLEEGCVLARQRVLRLFQDAHEVLALERLELDADRKAALELGDEVRDRRDVKRSRGDEEDVVGLHLAVLRADRGALDDGQEVPLHALARDVGAVTSSLAPRDLVDLVEEHDAGLLGARDRLALDLVHVDELLRLFVLEHAPRVAHLHAAPLLLTAAEAREVAEHVADVDLHLLHPVRAEDRHERVLRVRHVGLDELVLELSGAEVLAHLREIARGRGRRGHRVGDVGLARRRRDEERTEALWAGGPLRHLGGIRPREELHEALLGVLLRARPYVGDALLAHELDRDLHEVPDDRLDVAPDVADLGELRRLDLHERRARELREPARDLGLPDAGRADHDDVLRRDLVAEVGADLLAPPSVPERDGDGALRLVLPDDVPIELAHDLARRERRAGIGPAQSSSTTMLSFV